MPAPSTATPKKKAVASSKDVALGKWRDDLQRCRRLNVSNELFITAVEVLDYAVIDRASSAPTSPEITSKARDIIARATKRAQETPPRSPEEIRADFNTVWDRISGRSQ